MGARPSRLPALLLSVVLAGAFQVPAWPAQQEVAALVLFPAVLVEDPLQPGHPLETTVSILHTGSGPILARVAAIDGSSCSACEFDVPMVPNQPVVLLFRYTTSLQIINVETGDTVSCPGKNGFVAVSVRSPVGLTLDDNVLLGHSVVVDYAAGRSVSAAAIAVEGEDANDGNGVLELDGEEYDSLPAFVSTEFVAPDPPGTQDGVGAALVLMAPGFVNGAPPSTTCDVYLGRAGLDATGSPPQPDGEVQFGCWLYRELASLGSAFEYPLAGDDPRTGWLQLACRADADGDGLPEPEYGGVHGVLLQSGPTGAVVRRAQPASPPGDPAWWGRTLMQSATAGRAVTLDLGWP